MLDGWEVHSYAVIPSLYKLCPRSKHRQVYGKSAPVDWNHNFLVKRLNEVAECCLKWGFFFHSALFCYVRDSNVDVKMRSSKLIIKSIAQEAMTDSSFGHRFHDLKYFEVGFVFFIILEFFYKLESTITKNSRRKHKFDVILSYFKQVLNNYMINVSTCTLLALSSRICRIFLDYFLIT